MRILMLLLLTQISFGQIKGVVKDAKTGQPIPYVNIGIENQTSGFSADENGHFFYTKSGENLNLIFSAVGYKTITINSKDISNEVFMTQISIILPELQVAPPKHKITKTIGKISKKGFNSYWGNSGMPYITGRLIPYDENFSQTRYLKTIKVFTNSKVKDAVFNIRLFTMNKNNEPVECFSETNIIAKCKKGRQITEINVEHLNIKFPESGLLVGAENFIIESNKYTYDYEENNVKKKGVSYEPEFGGYM